MSDAAIMELNLPTGIPIVYELDKDLKPVKPMQFLGDEETVRKAMEAVAAQGKVKKWDQREHKTDSIRDSPLHPAHLSCPTPLNIIPPSVNSNTPFHQT